ncbi:MAG: biotin--[acetyl-CoA-carboxylase] ligase [Acidimicrobiales bacterium]
MGLPERVVADLCARTRFGAIRHLEETDSTNRVVAEAAAAGAPEGLVVVAEHQTAGRGRLGRRWDAPAGTALLVSVLLRPAGLPPGRHHLAGSAVALAAAAACRSVAGFASEIKWPNDLLFEDRKLAGILGESAAGAVVVGLGLNLSAAPPGAISAAEASGGPVDGAAVLAEMLLDLDARLGRWDAVAADYAASCATVGRRVRVEVVAGPAREGDALAVDHDGRLVVAFGGGRVEALAAADVVHVRAAGAARRRSPPA